MTAPADRDELTEKQRQDLERGIESAKGHPPVDRGSFAQYADDEQAPGEVEGWTFDGGCNGYEHPTEMVACWMAQMKRPPHPPDLVVSGIGDNRVPLPVLRALLAHHGLHIVGAEERDAIGWLGMVNDGDLRRIEQLSEYTRNMVHAELARRAGKERG